jgi:hypothetical protein
VNFSRRTGCENLALWHFLKAYSRTKRLCGRVSLVIVPIAIVLAAPLIAAAQGNNIPARVTDRVDSSRMTTLRGNTHPLARVQYDQGAAPADLPMNRILLVLQRSADQETALRDLLDQQQVSGSPKYHKWLTPAQFGQQFGPADADIQAVTSWLASFGFQSIKVSKGRTVIEFSGTASQVEAALHTPIHRYVVNGESHWANANDPQIPTALAPVVAGFASLHNFPKKPASVRSGRTASLTRTREGKPQINFTDGSHGIAPADFAKIYNIGSSMTGGGVTIGVVARSNINVQDVIDFRNTFGLPANNPNIILDGPDPGDLGSGEEAEAVLDATWPGAVAPAATVDLVVSESTNAEPGEDLSEVYIIDNNLADVMTESFSLCETFAGSSLASLYSGLAEQAAAQGITYLVSSGDGGPDSCDNQNSVPATPTPASVNVLASTPFTIAVGGTEFHDCDPMPRCVDTSATYWNSPGTSTESAKSYIPENVWNESCTVAQCGSSLTGLWSSGGGQSAIFSKPSWQAGVAGIPSGNRAVPDFSVTAADHDGYVLCLALSCEGGSPGFAILSGTSASVQASGGIMALVDQSTGARQGQANYVFYKLAAAETFANCNGSAVPPPVTLSGCVFNDVTVGNTNIPEVNPLETGFAAGVGYDEATGLGSVNVTNLLASWSTAVSKGTTTMLSLNGGSAVNVTHGARVPVSATVTATSGTAAPTGDVSLIALTANQAGSSTGQGVDFGTLTPGTGTSSTVNGNTTLLPGGTYNVRAHYAGDGNFLGSDSNTVSVTVNPELSLTSLGIVTSSSTSCPTSTSVTYGSGYHLSVAVVDKAAATSSSGPGTVCLPTPTGAAPTGTVHVTDNGANLDGLNGSGNSILNSGGYFEDQAIQLSVGTHNIQAAYQGDSSFNASSTSAPTITVTQASTVSSITSNPSSVTANTNFTITAFVDTQLASGPGSTGAAPTGTITFTATTSASVPGSPSRHEGPGSSPLLVAEILTAIWTLFLLFPVKRHRGAGWLATAVVLVIAVGVSCAKNKGGGNNNSTTTLGTANVSGALDKNGFPGAMATLNTAKLSSTATITAAYSGDTNYKGSTSSAVSVTVH